MDTNFNKLEDWVFEIEEISAGVYRVSAVDRMGRKVERTGTDPDQLRSECQQDAKDIQLKIQITGPVKTGK